MINYCGKNGKTEKDQDQHTEQRDEENERRRKDRAKYSRQGLRTKVGVISNVGPLFPFPSPLPPLTTRSKGLGGVQSLSYPPS